MQDRRFLKGCDALLIDRQDLASRIPKRLALNAKCATQLFVQRIVIFVHPIDRTAKPFSNLGLMLVERLVWLSARYHSGQPLHAQSAAPEPARRPRLCVPG